MLYCLGLQKNYINNINGIDCTLCTVLMVCLSVLELKYAFLNGDFLSLSADVSKKFEVDVYLHSFV